MYNKAKQNRLINHTQSLTFRHKNVKDVGENGEGDVDVLYLHVKVSNFIGLSLHKKNRSDVKTLT